ncbi:hypothetical protein DPEC_G00336380 [Dallia pectoralis]|uniref:Uncharacterized protein n=1 Tax=Dallia pectoralis TaxID=75939 RepID=A0ACC2F7K5_DALPE|nr:hypothetical protein DPEC_G00336380 [Dallia pectoralis]
MTHCELEDITMHLNTRISSIRRVLELRTIAKDQDKRVILEKIGQEVHTIDGLLDQFEKCVVRQKDLLKHLKELEGFFQEDVHDGKHLKENKPTHMPAKGQPAVHGRGPLGKSRLADVQPGQQENPRKASKNHIKEMQFITSPEFESIPQ